MTAGATPAVKPRLSVCTTVHMLLREAWRPEYATVYAFIHVDDITAVLRSVIVNYYQFNAEEKKREEGIRSESK